VFLASVPNGVIDAGRAIGLTRTQVALYVILSIMLRNSLSALGTTFISLFKDTSLAATIAVQELTFRRAENQAGTCPPAFHDGYGIPELQSFSASDRARQCHAYQGAGMNRQSARAEVISWLARVGLENRAGHYPTERSGGQQQRVAIPRVLAMNPCTASCSWIMA
jgi:ABC-type dipeptide/oligopeptide/nickel transport system ATPase subunit